MGESAVPDDEKSPIHSLYWPYYCEESVWQLCDRLEDQERSIARAVMISNPLKQVLFWHQKPSTDDEAILWDYHVILLRRRTERWWAWDLSSHLSCPIPAEDYLFYSFRPDLAVPPELRPRFRLISASEYRSQLASDRSHMRQTDGTFHAPPPPWPAIGQGTNLDVWLDMARPVPGRVLDLVQLREWILTDSLSSSNVDHGENRDRDPGDTDRQRR